MIATGRPSGWGDSLVAALLATLVRPRWWALSLAGFLVRGGVLVLALPIWIFPTPAQLTSLAGPSVIGAGLASPTPALVAIVVGGLVGLSVALLASSLLGGWIDADLVRAAAADDELGALELRTVPADLAATVRVVAHLPTLAAVVVAGAAVIESATLELLNPVPSSEPLVMRVIGHMPLPVAILVAAWILGEAWGGVAVRELAVGAGVVRSLGRGLRTLLSLRGIATLVVTDAVVLAAAAAMWLVLGRAFDRVWPVVLDGADPAMLVVPVVLLAASWAAALWLIALVTAWRAAMWTTVMLAIRAGTVTPAAPRAS